MTKLDEIVERAMCDCRVGEKPVPHLGSCNWAIEDIRNRARAVAKAVVEEAAKIPRHFATCKTRRGEVDRCDRDCYVAAIRALLDEPASERNER